ncbi:hypothetical protein [Fluviicola sp.]|uniref:hypothetical protein n=1 Tax=Fluviicola sp. TaxID=1917219 RepID=UPI002615C973|nr:hypothetical protein [Fluviicola sp.]
MERKQPYNTEIIQRLYEQLCFLQKQGNSRDYEIRLDHLTVVPRTNNTDVFYSYEACLGEWTQELSVWIYKGSSRVADKYAFILRESETEKGGYTQIQVDALIARTKRDYAQGMEMSELRSKVKRQKRTIKQLRKALEAKEHDTSGQVAGLISSLSKTNLLDGVLNTKDHQERNEQPVPDSATINGLDTSELVNVFAHYKKELGEVDFEAVLGIALTLAQNPKLVAPVREFIQQQIPS